MRLVDRCSLKTQMILIVLWTSTVILLLTGVLFALYDLAQFRREKARELEVLGRLLAEHSVAPLVFQDAPAATEVLEGVRSIPSVQIAALYTPDGRPFAWYLNGVEATELPERLPAVEKGRTFLHHVETVRWEGQTQGYVYLRASLLGWRERMIHYASVGGNVILLALGISMILVALLQRGLVRPLERLRQVVRSVAETHDYSIRVPVEGPVELRELAATFNEMLTRVQEHQAVLVAAKEAAEEMARLKSTFLANMNHEIRTPLAGILGYAQILEEELQDPMQREMAQVIKQSGQRLLDTLDSLLYMSCLEAGTVCVHHRELDVVAATRAVINELEPLARSKKLELTLQSSEAALTACIDEGLWERLVKNLVHNAIKFTEKGGVTVLLEGDAETIQLQVADTGIGIPEELQSVIFEEFKQASSGLSRDYEGSGLGLTIVQRIVRLLDGQIYVESQPGIGSIFTVIIPRRREQSADSRVATNGTSCAQA
ncbi:ATP-binding protein [Rhodothermus profundi]|uniref:histidine kinase n=1 Tax=Rhodothermus profundi TaxID=633813 RepID=A0A1M6TJE8_9BACT|nr:ATP-binding protein [Rhodothermus profundi]SHK57111.1 Signal transduction histidine kinase [Rhodothermus profundi]